MSNIAYTESGVRIGRDYHPIAKVPEPFTPTPEYTIFDFAFTDELKTRANGCLFDISPFGSTGVMQITSPDLVSERVIVSGRGWFLGMNPEGQVIRIALDAENKEMSGVVLKQGWVDCFIAGPNGMKVVDVSMPPFRPDMEVQIVTGSPELPERYWEHHKSMRTPTSLKK